MGEALRQKDQVERVKLYQVSPELYEAMQVLSNAAAKDIDPELAELIKIRASQLNHCAFCLDMHSHDARNRGISAQKLTLVCGLGGGGRRVHRT
jgi:AhpD family alkylhydroperoxidase